MKPLDVMKYIKINKQSFEREDSAKDIQLSAFLNMRKHAIISEDTISKEYNDMLTLELYHAFFHELYGDIINLVDEYKSIIQCNYPESKYFFDELAELLDRNEIKVND